MIDEPNWDCSIERMICYFIEANKCITDDKEKYLDIWICKCTCIFKRFKRSKDLKFAKFIDCIRTYKKIYRFGKFNYKQKRRKI